MDASIAHSQSVATQINRGRSARFDDFFDNKWRIFPFMSELQAVAGEYPMVFIYVHVVVDVLQILSFSVLPQNCWGTVMTGITETINFTHLPVYDYLGGNFYATFVIAAIFVVLYAIQFAYIIVQCFRMRNYVAGSAALSSTFFHMLRAYVYLMSSILFVPLVEILLSIAFSSKGSNPRHLSWFSSIPSDAAVAQVGIALCVLGMIMHSTVAHVANTHYVEIDIASIHPLRRSNTDPDDIYLLFRIVSCILYQYFYSAGSMQYFCIYMAVASLLMTALYTTVLPFYSERMNKTRIMTLALACVFSVFSGISHVDKVSEFFVVRNTGLDALIFLLSLPILGVLFYHTIWRARVSPVYLHAMRELKKGKLSNPVVHIPKNLPRDVENLTRFSHLLDEIESARLYGNNNNNNNNDNDNDNGHIGLEEELITRPRYATEDVSADPALAQIFRTRHFLSRFIAPYVDSIVFSSDVEVAVRFLPAFTETTGIDISGYQLRYATTVYLKALSKYPTDCLPRLTFVTFLLYQCNHPQVALTYVRELRSKEAPLWLSFLAWRLEAEISNRLHLGQNNRVAALNKAKDVHRKAVHSTTDLWHVLMDKDHQFSDISAANTALMRFTNESKLRYETLLASDPGNLEVLSCYAIFCDQVLDDREMANQCTQHIRQAVETRHQDKMRGAKMKGAIGASLTQLKLSLAVASNNMKQFARVSRVKFLFAVSLLLGLFSLICMVMVLVFMVLKYEAIHNTEHCMYYLGQLRVLTTQIALGARTIKENNRLNVDTAKEVMSNMIALRNDFISLYNEMMFGKHSRSTMLVKAFFRDLAVRQIDSGIIIHLWAYIGVSLGAVQDVVSHPKESLYTDWIAEEFNSELTLALTTTSDTLISQCEQDGSKLMYICIPLLAANVTIMIIGILIFFNSVYKVKGVRAITFTLLKLVPFSEIRRIHKRSLRQHFTLDAFLTLSTRDKVMKLIGASEEAEKQRMATQVTRGSHKHRSLLQVVADISGTSMRYLISAEDPSAGMDASTTATGANTAWATSAVAASSSSMGLYGRGGGNKKSTINGEESTDAADDGATQERCCRQRSEDELEVSNSSSDEEENSGEDGSSTFDSDDDYECHEGVVKEYGAACYEYGEEDNEGDKSKASHAVGQGSPYGQFGTAMGTPADAAGKTGQTKRCNERRKRRERLRASRRRRQAREQLLLEGIVSEQSYILSRDRSTSDDVAFSRNSIILFVALVLMMVAVVVVNILAIPHPRDTHAFYSGVMNSDMVVRNVKVNVVFSLLNTAFFVIQGSQRYYNDYIVMRSQEQWEALRTTYADRLTDPAFAALFFELSTMYEGIIEILDIALRFACSTFKDNCATNRIQFEYTYINSVQWGDEESLIMTRQAAAAGVYNTYFGVLKGSQVDLAQTPQQQLEMAKKLLTSDLLNDYVDQFFQKLSHINGNLSNSDSDYAFLYGLISLILGAVATVGLAASTVYLLFKKSRVMSCFITIFLRGISFLLLVSVVVLSIVNVTHLNEVKVDVYMKESREVSNKWNLVLYSSFWYPLMYVATHDMEWNLKYRNLRTEYSNELLLKDLSTVGGVQFTAADEQQLDDAQRLSMITMALIFAATKDDPGIQPYSSIFNDEYLSTYTWDFRAQSDYYVTLAKYGSVDIFYSTNEADLQLPRAGMINLAMNTLISNRQDNSIEVLNSYVLRSDTLVNIRLAKDGVTLDKQSQLFFITMILSIVALGCLVVGFMYTFVIFTLDIVFVNRRNTRVGIGTSAGSKSSGMPSSVEEAKAEAHNEQTKQVTTITNGGGGRGNAGAAATTAGNHSMKNYSSSIELGKNSNNNNNNSQGQFQPSHTGSHLSIVAKSSQQTTLVSENQERSHGSGKSVCRVVAPFVSFALIIITTVIVIVLLPVFTNTVNGMSRMTIESTERGWIVAQTMYLAKQINDDMSYYATVSENLNTLYKRHSTLLNALYFKDMMDVNSGYGFITHDQTQDDFLFSRNEFYSELHFLGPRSQDDSNEDFETLYVAGIDEYTKKDPTSPFFCSYKVQTEVMVQYSRGLGLFYDVVWPGTMRATFDGETASFVEAFTVISNMYRNTLIGVAQSDYIYNNFSEGKMQQLFIVSIAFTALTILIILISVLCTWLPFAKYLMQEDAQTRLMIRSVPSDIREKFPVFTQFLSNRAHTLTDEERVDQTMKEMAKSAVVASDANGVIIRFNDLAEELFGYNAAEVIGRNISLLMDAAMAEKHQQYLDNFDETSIHFSNRTREVEARRKDGKLLDTTVRVNSMRLSDTGETIFIAFFEEIGDRARLALLEQINRTAIEMNPDGIILIDNTGTMLRVNEAVATSFRYDPEEMVGQNVNILMPDDIAQFHNSYLRQYMDTGVKRRIDATTNIPGKRKDGTEFRLNITITELKNSSDQTYFLGYLEDTTRSRELEQMRGLYETAVNLSPTPIITVDSSCAIVGFSKSASELFQYKPEELIVSGPSWVSDINTLIPERYECNHMNDIFGEKGILMRNTDMQSDTAVVTANVTAERKDGTAVPAALIACDIQPDPMILRNRLFLTFLSDTSREAHLEDMGRLATAVFETNAYPVMVLDYTGVITSVNRSALECFGVSSKYEMIGENCSAFTSEADEMGIIEEQIVTGGGHKVETDETEIESAAVQDDKKIIANLAEEKANITKNHVWLGEYPRTLQKGRYFNCNRSMVAKRKDGTAFPLELRLVEVSGTPSASPLVIAFLRDLTEDQRISQSYHISETLEDVCPTGILVVDLNGRITHISSAAEECFGYHSSAVLDANVKVLIPSLSHPSASDSGGVGSADASFARHSNSPGSRASFLNNSASRNDHNSSLGAPNVQSVGVAGGSASDVPTILLNHVAGEGSHTVVARRSDGRLFPLEIRVEQLDMQNPRDVPLYAVFCSDTTSEVQGRQFASFHRSLRGMLDIPFVLLDSSGNIVSASEPFLSDFRYKNGELGSLMGKSFARMFISSTARDTYTKAMEAFIRVCDGARKAAVATGATMSSETDGTSCTILNDGSRTVRIRCADGTDFFASCRLVGMNSIHTSSVSFVLFVEPYNVQPEEQLASHINDAVMDMAPVASVITDLHGCILRVSGAAAALFGYDNVEDLVDLSINKLMPTDIAAEHDEYLATFMANFLAVHNAANGADTNGDQVVAASEKEMTTMKRITQQTALHKSGRCFPVEIVMRVAECRGAQPLFVVCIRSLELKQQAASMCLTNSIMLEQLPLCAVVTTREGTIEQVNWTLCHEFGYRSSGELVGKDVGVLMTSEDAQYHKRHIANYLRTKMKFALGNTVVRNGRRENGEVFRVAIHVKEVTPASQDPKDIRFVAYMVPEGGDSRGATLGPSGTIVTDVRRAIGEASRVKRGKGGAERVLPQHEINGRRVRHLESWLREPGLSFAIVDEQGKILNLSAAAEATFACVQDEATGRHLSFLLSRESHRSEMYGTVSNILDVLNRVGIDAHGAVNQVGSNANATVTQRGDDRPYSGVSDSYGEDLGQSTYLHNNLPEGRGGANVSSMDPRSTDSVTLPPTKELVDSLRQRRTLVQRRSGEWFPVDMRWSRVDSSAIVSFVGDTEGTASEVATSVGTAGGDGNLGLHGRVYVVVLEDLSKQCEAMRLKELYDGAIELCTAPTVFADSRGVVKVFNAAAEKCFGYTAQEVLGKNVKLLMPRKTAAMHDRFMETYLKTGVARMLGSNRDITAKRRDGTHFPATIILKEVKETEGHFFIAHIVDNTVATQSEIIGVLGRAVLTETSSAVLVLNAQDAVMQASPHAVRLLQYSDHEAELLAPVTPSSPSVITERILFGGSLHTYTAFVRDSIKNRHKSFANLGSSSSTVATAGSTVGVKSSTAEATSSPMFSTIRNSDDVVQLMTAGAQVAGGRLENSSAAAAVCSVMMGTGPCTVIPAVALRCRGGAMATADVEVRVVFCGTAYLGCVLRLRQRLFGGAPSLTSLASPDGNDADTALALRDQVLATGSLKCFQRPLFMLNRSGHMSTVNPALATTLGYANVGEAERVLVGMLVSTLFPEMQIPEAGNRSANARVQISPSTSVTSAASLGSCAATLEHEQVCVAALSAFTTPSVLPASAQESAVAMSVQNANPSPRVLKALCKDGTTKKLLLERFVGLSTLPPAASSTDAASGVQQPATQLSDIQFFLGELGNIETAHTAAVQHEVSRNLLSVCPLPMLVAQASTGSIIDVNNALLQEFDFTRDNVIDQKLHVLLSRSTGIGSTSAQVDDALMRQFEVGPPRRVTGESRTGRTFSLEVVVAPVTIDEVACLVIYMTPDK